MRLRISVVLMFTLAAARCVAQTAEAPKPTFEVLRDAAQFRDVPLVQKLPQEVVKLCADHKGRIADPGQKWEATDAIRDETLPRHRLIWAYSNGEYFVLHYEEGGIVHTYRVSISRLTKGAKEPVVVWNGASFERKLENYATFLKASKPIEAELDGWPKTVQEAVTKILNGMSDKDKAEIKNTKREDLIMFHMGWGTGIRNGFGLWKGNEALMKDCHANHPDDASMVIIEAVWVKLQNP